LYGVGDNPEQTVQVVESFATLDDSTWLLCTGAKDISLPDGHIWRSTDAGSTWTLVLTMSHGYVTDFGWTGILGTNIVIGEYGRTAGKSLSHSRMYNHGI